MKATLYAPPGYISASTEVREKVVNGCGRDGWKGQLVPDRIWWLEIEEACNIHDWMYAAGETLADKQEADRVLLNNLLRLIDAAGGPWWLQWLRRQRASKYYDAVAMFGGPAFWDNKNDPSYMLDVSFGRQLYDPYRKELL